MGLKMKVALWEFNNALRRNAYGDMDDASAPHRIHDVWRSIVPPSATPFSLGEYLIARGDEKIAADFRGGAWRIARRTAALAIGLSMAIGCTESCEPSHGALPAPSGTTHEGGGPVGATPQIDQWIAALQIVDISQQMP